MSDRETLRRIGSGIMERMPNVVRVRAGAAAWHRLWGDLKACEYEYDYVDENGQTQKAIMGFHWSRPGMDRAHVLVYGKPVELHPELTADEIIYDGRESM